MFEENDREKDILSMLFVVQITILAETVEADALFALFFVALLVFGFIVLKELARRFAESQFSERLRGRP